MIRNYTSPNLSQFDIIQETFAHHLFFLDGPISNGSAFDLMKPPATINGLFVFFAFDSKTLK